MGLQDHVVLLLIRILRAYTRNTLFERGRFRLTNLLFHMTKLLSKDARLNIKVTDGRIFQINPRDSQYHMGLLDRGIFEPEESQAVNDCVRPGQVVIDAGANYGWYSTLLSRSVGSAGSVHAFEAMPSTANTLRINCQLNGCANVIINQSALGDRLGTTVIYDHPDRASGDASLFPIATSKGWPYTCEMQTLDHYFMKRGLSQCDFIKCDVEGAELLFLKGARQVVKQYRPNILLEINPAVLRRSGTDGEEILQEIRGNAKYGFHVVGQHSQLIEPADCKNLKTYINILCTVN